MTPPIDDLEALRRILANTNALLLDFDGPICSVFAGFPAPVVAAQLRDILAEGGHTHLPEHIQAATDPFDVLFYAAQLGPEEARYVEAAFTAHEVEAIQTAQPTPGAYDLVHAWKATGRSLAIVSNNSVNSIEVYVDRHNLSPLVDCIAARRSADTSQLKPSPYLVNQVANALVAEPARCALVGDSPSDIQAAKGIGVLTIGYANKSAKLAVLATCEPAAIVTSLDPLVRSC